MNTLVLWYRQNKRQMPWRETRDPYAIWVSETMLQQTRVETVIPYYHRFMTSFPSIAALAAADEEAVLKHWQGLGYYSRARNLHGAARAAVETCDGRVPEDVSRFRQLPGVGPYTAGAVFSIAFDQPVPAVDGNVLRVMSRYLGIFDPIESSAVTKRIAATVETWLSESTPRDATQALMELGATLCSVKSPRCLVCPLRNTCAANLGNYAEALPVRKKKQDRKVVDVVAVWWEQDGAVLMQQRAESGLLANMWQLPAFEVRRENPAASGTDGEGALMEKLRTWVAGCANPDMVAERAPLQFALIAEEKHVFTHLEWHVKVFRPIGLKWGGEGPRGIDCTPMSFNRLQEVPLPRVYEKIFDKVLGDTHFAKEA